jgi:hypothetical protein
MKYLKTTIWLLVFIGITILFNISFRMIFTPAGIMGDVSAVNVAASIAYIFFWIILSVIAGYKKFRNVLTAAFIYSSLPFFSLLGTLFMGTRLAIIIMIVFYWGVPVQGINYTLVYLQLPLFLLGYIIGSYIKKKRLSK